MNAEQIYTEADLSHAERGMQFAEAQFQYQLDGFMVDELQDMVKILRRLEGCDDLTDRDRDLQDKPPK